MLVLLLMLLLTNLQLQVERMARVMELEWNRDLLMAS